VVLAFLLVLGDTRVGTRGQIIVTSGPSKSSIPSPPTFTRELVSIVQRLRHFVAQESRFNPSRPGCPLRRCDRKFLYIGRKRFENVPARPNSNACTWSIISPATLNRDAKLVFLGIMPPSGVTKSVSKNTNILGI